MWHGLLFHACGNSIEVSHFGVLTSHFQLIMRLVHR